MKNEKKGGNAQNSTTKKRKRKRKRKKELVDMDIFLH